MYWKININKREHITFFVEEGFILWMGTEEQEGRVPVARYIAKLSDETTAEIRIEQKPYFYVEEEHAKELTTNELSIEKEITSLQTLTRKPVTKLICQNETHRNEIRKILGERNIPSHEADIRLPYRVLIQQETGVAVKISGARTPGTYTEWVYTNPVLLASTQDTTKLSILSIDIETNKDATEIWSVALSTKTTTHAIILNRTTTKATTVTTEKELLTQLNERIQQINPDIITGWNVIDFDLAVLQKKYRAYDIPMNWGRDETPVKLRLESDYLKESTAEITGRAVLDGIHLLRTNFVDLDNFQLETAAQHYLGKGKLFTGENRFEHIEENYNQNPEELIRYNIQDAQLVLDILEKSNTLALTKKRSFLTGMPLQRVQASIASLDMVYLPKLHKKGFVAPSTGWMNKSEPITGGFVMESKPGIYDNIIVCDFKSLYPSIIRTLNIDPLSYDASQELKESTENYVRAENGACFRQEQGILPEILAVLWDERANATKNGDQLARFAIKILMNSFFGVLASPNCRFFSMAVANAITTTGQHLIQTAAEHIRALGYEVIYSDTDSVFMNPCILDSGRAQEIGEEIQQEINTFFTEYARKRYASESKLELEFEKLYVRFLMPHTRGGAGSKKRYAGLLVRGEEKKIDVTGLEIVRRDWTALAKEFQQRMLEIIFDNQQPHEFIKTYVQEVRAGKKDDLLIYIKALRKNVDSYTKTTPPHVKAARLLDKITDNLISYVMTVNGPEPIQKTTHSIDYEHYIEKQLKPIADGILVFYDTTFSDVLKGTSQKGLFDF